MRVFLLVKGDFQQTQKACVVNMNDQRPTCLGATRHGGEYMWEANVKDHTDVGKWFAGADAIGQGPGDHIEYAAGTLLWFRFLEG